MIDDSDENLAQEATAMQRFQELHVERLTEINRDVDSCYYRSDYQANQTPNNRAFGHIAMMLPEICYSRPSVYLQSSRPKSQKETIDALEAYLNGWSEMGDFGFQLIRTARQMLVGFGVMMCSLQSVSPVGEEGYQGGRVRPRAENVPCNRFLIDHKCDHWLEARLLGHRYERDLDWLYDNRKLYDFDRKLLDSLPASVDDTQDNTSARRDTLTYRHGAGPPRHMVSLCDLWCRERKSIYTLVMAGHVPSSRVLRRADYRGPDSGPYEVFGAYLADGDPYPISLLQAVYLAFREMNAHAVAINDASKTYKKFAIVAAGQKELADAAIAAQNGDVWKLREFNPQLLAQLELGGANQQQVAHYQSLVNDFDQTIGEGSTQRGQPSDKTATAEELASQNADAKKSWVKEQFYVGVTRVYQKVTWFACDEPNIVEEITLLDSGTRQQIEAVFMGGQQPGQENVDWSTIQCSIVDDSMSYQDNQVVQARAQQLTELIPQWYQMKMTMPGVNVGYIVDTWGESNNIKDLDSLVYDDQAIQAAMRQQQQMAAMQQQAQAAAPPGTPIHTPQPVRTPGPMGGGGGGGGGRGAAKGNAGNPRSNGPGMSPLPRSGVPKTVHGPARPHGSRKPVAG